MVQATRRVVPLPPLSITIPHSVDNERRGRSREGEPEYDDEDEYLDIGTPTNSEPFQKQVKFLAPDDAEEDGMSEQSSICQSPSWEGYGQKKKEKKLEAERRKREKQQAEKDAKAAKKRNGSRLSKAPPPPMPPMPSTREPRAVGLTTADRSLSDPLLVSRHLASSSPSVQRAEDAGRTASADNLQQTRRHRPGVAEVFSSHTPGANLITSSPVAIPHHFLRDGYFTPRQDSRRSMSEGPAAPAQHPPLSFPSNSEAWPPRDAFPPSASRTPRLRHMSPSGGNRNNGLLPGATGTNNSQESLSTTGTGEGVRRNGYVRYQRAQAAERAMAGLADEQLVGNVDQYYPPSRSASSQIQHTRRSSLTQDAKSAALKLVGMKAPPSARDDGVDTGDYLSFKSFPYATSGTGAAPSVDSMPASPRNLDGSFGGHLEGRPSQPDAAIPRSTGGPFDPAPALERPSTSQSFASSSDPSITGSKKSRSLKDAAKAALSMSKTPQKRNESPKPAVAVPPFLALRSRLHSRVSVQSDNKSTQETTEVTASELASVCPHRVQSGFVGCELSPTDTLQKLITASSVAEQSKPTEMAPEGGSRASEGSSSSSGYEDGSPLASPTTTPDTSRPTSAKDVPLVSSEPAKETLESFGLQDDERTLRQSLDSSKSSTPRLGESETPGATQMGNEDRWSRTALPIDIDCDAQSFITTVSNLDNLNEPEKLSTNGQSSPHGKEHPERPTQPSSQVQKSVEMPASIPPRSRKRSRSSSVGSLVASSPLSKHQFEDGVAAQEPFKVPEDQDPPKLMESPKIKASRNYARPFQQGEGKGKKENVSDRYKADQQQEPDKAASLEGHGGGDEFQAAPSSPDNDWTSGSVSLDNSTVPSAGSTSPRVDFSDFQFSTSPYFGDLSESLQFHDMLGDTPGLAGPPSPVSLPSPLHPLSPRKTPVQSRANSAPALSVASTTPSRASTPSVRSSGTVPVSILKQPKHLASEPSLPSVPRPPVLSALPKHMQLQAGIPVRPPALVAEARLAPIAKMFVECCSCKFYHDMPSKLYECMAKPDAVVEDKLLGISGAITTMVKCPWCHHNMSRNCCAGYAAVVYLKEKLH